MMNRKMRIAMIEKSGKHLLELINDILELSKIEANQLELNMTMISVVQLCKSSLVFVKQQAFKKQIQLSLSLPPDLGEIVLDERRIRQVLINLLSNAVKFTPAKGQVMLNVKIENNQNLLDSETWITFSVADTGIGIAESDQNRLFQPFVQIDSSLNRRYEGTGLGLALVKQIVELHGGDVSLDSELGQGSCFTVRLPYKLELVDDSTATRPKYLHPIADAPVMIPFDVITEFNNINSPLILLAEDNEINVTTVSSYLEAKGYRILLAKNGQEAIKLTQSHRPDLILMNVQMPEVSGFEAIQKIREDEELLSIPIIALTALAMIDDQQKCLDSGASEYIAKPVKLKQLTATIQRLLGVNLR